MTLQGKGAAALELFYRVYLSLEGKDRLHFIALQKEREKLAPASSRFGVTRVSEEPPPYQPAEHHLSKPLIEFADTILWHRNKFWSIVQACKNERRRFEAEYPIVEPVEYFIPDDVVDEWKKESEGLDEFAHKHPARKTKKQLVECCPQKKFFDVSYAEDSAAAAEYVEFLKKRGERVFKYQDLKLKTQTTMMADTWEKLLRQQDKSFDEALGLRVLDQSRYEKQIMRKLCEVRDLRNKVVENRRIVDAMLLKILENEQRLQQHRELETMAAEAQDVGMEYCRMRELHRRIREEKVREKEKQKVKSGHFRPRASPLRAKVRRFGEMYRGICLEIVKDLADIAVKIAEFRQANDSHVPPFVWSDCKTLFLRNQPIFEFAEYLDLFDVEDAVEDGEEEEEKNVDIQREAEDKVTIRRMKNGEVTEDEKEEARRTESGRGKKAEDKRKLLQLKLDHQRVLADADFENYRDLASPWAEFAPTKEKGQAKDEDEAEEVFRLGRLVLGYVVHRLLRMLHRQPTEITTRLAPRVEVAAIVLGIMNATLLEELRELLKKYNVHLLRMEDAINRCLERYKQEMVDVEYIDLDVIPAKARDVRRPRAKGKGTNATKNRRMKLPERATMKNTMTTQRQKAAEEKQTQTPRQIPYDDLHPTLSDAAYIGKWTHEFLTLGQPIPNELNTKILMEYLKGIGDVKGWALINYPNTYEQMAMLEEALTGHRVPPDRNKVFDLADVNVEDIDPPSPRMLFEADEVDTIAICGQSRLLPNSICPKEKYLPNSSTTFVTLYIKALPKPKTLASQDDSSMLLPADATSMDEYYADRNIAYGFYYNVLDLSAMKQLVEFITGDRLAERTLEEALSLDLLEEIPRDRQKPPIDPKAAITKRWVPKSKWEKSQREEKKDSEAVSRDLPAEMGAQLARTPARPGEDGWQWMDFPQPPLLLETLAMLWESVEEGYVENLKEILSLKRIHTSTVIPYKESVLSNLRKFIDRPDNRQDLLQDFHRAFNKFDEDLREDADVKCELHCRVVDFRAELWDLCDTRRHIAEEERKRILRNQWIPLETVVLVNVYIEILQTEIDRFIDTVQLLQDYYTSMLQKPLEESRFSKIFLDRVELKLGLREAPNSGASDGLINDEEKETAIQTKASSHAANIEHFKIDIEGLLTDVSRIFDPERNIVYDVIKDTIRQVRSVVESTSSIITETLKKEEEAAVLNVESRDKAIGSVSPNSTLTKLARRSRDLVEEWRYAVQFEIDRIRRRLDVLDAAARSDVAFLLDTMRRTFHHLHDYIDERYKREIESVDDMANVFCCAIEEAKPIQQEMLLEGDRFVVRSNVLMFPDDTERLAVPVQESSSPLRFRVIQLARLLDIFRRVAPHGVISKRGLVYILQDLVSCGEEDCYPAAVPCGWRQLRTPDIETLVERLFGGCEHIEWREFIVYAMDLPVPSHQDILRAQAAFRRQDPALREVIPRDRYRLTLLWFLENVGTSADIFHEYLYGDPEALLDEKDDCNDYREIMDTMLCEAARLGARTVIDLGLRNDLIETSENSSGYAKSSLISIRKRVLEN
ncbi:sperm flagellar protein 2-like [Harpegnathos saltator]|uniref:sperm flagellar protein 2-like n=1 Tax=Harpegnathos saltator TaxID=610380 RepID=UPI000DBEE40B|nr:sperm flagellar protein 2-like [Harpegnathos saltator]